MKKRYIKSNNFLTVDYNDFSHEEYQALLHSGSKAENRKAAAQKLIEYLCNKYEIPRCTVWVADRMRPTRRGGTYWGIYYGWNRVITIFNNMDFMRPCDIRTFINTLLHEFMHHYDYYYLGLRDSVHCVGFDSRVRDLRRKLAS